MTVVMKDSNGAELKDGNSVTLIKDLKVKSSSVVSKPPGPDQKISNSRMIRRKSIAALRK